MKNGLFTLAWVGLIWVHCFVPVVAQQLSTNQVNYQLTYDAPSQTYTAWVVPRYATPNSNNSDANEFGATAQVSLKVPKDFVIQNITDIRGTWEKSPLKLGNQPVFASSNLDPNFLYYVIGKTPTEVNYGTFANGTPVALFTFRGNSCQGPVGILAKTDPFVTVAKTLASLNTACSFYSRSGQAISGNVIPLEQFVDKLGPDAACTTPCVKPNAGPDQTLICATTPPTTANLVDAAVGQKWKVLSVQPNTTVSITTPEGLVSGMTASGEYRFVLQVQSDSLTCRDTVSVIIPNCVCPQVNILTPNATACRGRAFSTLNVAISGNNTQGVGAEWFANATGGSALATGLSYTPTGIATVTDTFYVALTGVSGNCLAVPRTPVIVTVQDCNIDLSLTVATSNQQPGLNGNITLTVTVTNEGQNPASGVEVKNILPAGMSFQTFATATGTYNSGTGTWTIGNIAVGQTVTLSIGVQVTQTGVQYFTAEISKADQGDVDSTPNNGVETEDDFDRTCVTVPAPICAGQIFELSIPNGYTNIQWYKDNQLIPNATTSVLQVTQSGTYRFTATNVACPTAGCCSFIFFEGDCCPTKAICVPFTITKVRK
ncbi:DUF11 domain-containing protein [Runella sp. SP2]|uniref:Ig-like domain-containing protein n=1 Tax=Runella sp. SP2 TaxID=2268026 RepID=UPI000F07DAC5|nr:DUF11 domain-containing protein [Runella sp. SP2]AYQ31333.1 DUF11 domain-containing protein [Runella sp. SP2]